MGLFVVLYILASLNYPGGSWNDVNHKGFSFWNNYLCDLLDKYAINGALNSGRYYARAALGVLCLSLLFLWLNLHKLVTESINTKIMTYSGVLALLTTFFLASNTHDIIVRISGVFGVVAILSLTVEQFKMHYIKLGLLGVTCIVIFLINYYVYETGFYLKCLPIIQKFTFAAFMVWFSILNAMLYCKSDKV
nr:hypothetical protein [Winogradskyella alexanderae]